MTSEEQIRVILVLFFLTHHILPRRSSAKRKPR